MEQNKLKKITEIIQEDTEKAKELFMMTPAEAAKAFNDMGCEVTEEEMLALGEELRAMAISMSQGDELSATELEAVAGGSFESFLKGTLAGSIVAAGLILAGVATMGW